MMYYCSYTPTSFHMQRMHVTVNNKLPKRQHFFLPVIITDPLIKSLGHNYTEKFILTSEHYLAIVYRRSYDVVFFVLKKLYAFVCNSD